MRKFFYARVSSKDQSLERQIYAAKELGIDDECIFIEKASGKDFKRPEYQLLKLMLRNGDVLYLKSLDRLGRNKQMILDEWQELNRVKKIDIVVLDMPLLNTMKYKDLEGIESLISDLILQLLSYMAEDERKRINLVTFPSFSVGDGKSHCLSKNLFQNSVPKTKFSIKI